jgi:hypothetical protein
MFRRARGVKNLPVQPKYKAAAGTSVMFEALNGSRSERLRSRAAHCRALAATFTVEINRQKIEQLADDFERMAVEEESRPADQLSNPPRGNGFRPHNRK